MPFQLFPAKLRDRPEGRLESGARARRERRGPCGGLTRGVRGAHDVPCVRGGNDLVQQRFATLSEPLLVRGVARPLGRAARGKCVEALVPRGGQRRATGQIALPGPCRERR